MTDTIDCFLPSEAAFQPAVAELLSHPAVGRVWLMTQGNGENGGALPDGCQRLSTKGLGDMLTLKAISAEVRSRYILLLLSPRPTHIGPTAIDRLLQSARSMEATMVYADQSDLISEGKQAHPTIDYQEGSLRDDFDFGQMVLLRGDLLRRFVEENAGAGYRFAAFYALRLWLSRQGTIYHLNENLCTVGEMPKEDDSHEAQFNYVDPRNREAQIEMELAVTEHLRQEGALVESSLCLEPDFDEEAFPCEASVIIPVYNREKTIADAVNSALSQDCPFEYNVIVLDNHSTDGTTKILQELAAKSGGRLIHIIPERTDLGIGGCWNRAIDDERCGRFAVQLDSDDLYSSPSTLRQIVDCFRRERAAMVIGSYRMCDFQLNTLPPGLINHAEWTAENGANNALRINGLGAPRAFFIPLARAIRFPNTSYGEDYAMGLAFSRRYRIGRILTEVYLCRRWTGNSDHALSLERQNANNLYKDRLRTLELQARRQMNRGGQLLEEDSLEKFFRRELLVWPLARQNYRDLYNNVRTRDLSLDEVPLTGQCNPRRMVSTGAKIDSKTIASRACFLCEQNRPKEQGSLNLEGKFSVLINPYPILPGHFTIAAKEHRKQHFDDCARAMYRFSQQHQQLLVFYNGPRCGASAPDHLHFQAGLGRKVPLVKEWSRLQKGLSPIMAQNDDEGIFLLQGFAVPAFIVKSKSEDDHLRRMRRLLKALPVAEGDDEPMINVLEWWTRGVHVCALLPRRKHRPDCYFATGDNQLLVSPGALDMAGLLVMPREDHFRRITPAQALSILQEVAMPMSEAERIARSMKAAHEARTGDHEEPRVSVGIVSGNRINFTLNGAYTAKGQTLEGPQQVDISEGSILWNGSLYRELRFRPQQRGASFSISDVTIGINFHWERRETQTFLGTLRIVVEEDKLCAINELPVENYLESVISSEMRSTSSLELLKAHAVISRSWLLAQMKRRQENQSGGNHFFPFTRTQEELIRWYDREDHTIFDVCADDHCQRYQGITRENSPHVVEAVRSTRGETLCYDGEICDARFSKCCGGMTEEYRYCWEDEDKPYLKATADNAGEEAPADLSIEANAERWIRTAPKAFCNTSDRAILQQVLNDYDQETPDFYRWHVSYTQEELRKLIQEKTGIDFGAILDLQPVERGRSGRLSKLRIVGTERTMVIGKELEIRRTLSQSHLYSSAFVVDKEGSKDGAPERFVLTGAGWGHGVGLCQIGAAVMGAKGYSYKQILAHYYKGAQIEKKY